MTRIDHLQAQLLSLTPPQVSSFAAGVATRIEPVVVAFSQVAGRRTDDWLRRLWLEIELPVKHDGDQLLAEISAAPEASVDDSHLPEYYAIRALGPLAYAVETLSAKDPTEAALWCSRGAVGLLRDLDYELGIPEGSVESLAYLEEQAQAAWLGNVSSSPRALLVGERGLEAARDSEVFRRIRDVVVTVARNRGWPVTS